MCLTIVFVILSMTPRISRIIRLRFSHSAIIFWVLVLVFVLFVLLLLLSLLFVIVVVALSVWVVIIGLVVVFALS